MTQSLPHLPLDTDIMTPAIWKKLILAREALAQMRWVAQTIPNQSILINTLSLQESKDSSEIESIVTTHDELFRYDTSLTRFSPANKEVHRYNDALFVGLKHIQDNKPITTNLLTHLSQCITGRDSWLRNVPGTHLRNQDGDIIYTPPQEHQEILSLMNNLEKFINDSGISDLDPLVKMAIIHHQFESIHPFFDGNGRTGRILNILYLISEDLLDIPILYLSRYITKNKQQYYDLLQKARTENLWEEWILYILTAVQETAKQTIQTINDIQSLIQEQKHILREQTRFYSHELLNTLFEHPYTKIEFVCTNTGINRQTASKYLQELADIGLLEAQKHGRTMYYINTKLRNIFTNL